MTMLKEGDDDCLSVCVVCVPLGWLKMGGWIKERAEGTNERRRTWCYCLIPLPRIRNSGGYTFEREKEFWRDRKSVV